MCPSFCLTLDMWQHMKRYSGTQVDFADRHVGGSIGCFALYADKAIWYVAYAILNSVPCVQCMYHTLVHTHHTQTTYRRKAMLWQQTLHGLLLDTAAMCLQACMAPPDSTVM